MTMVATPHEMLARTGVALAAPEHAGAEPSLLDLALDHYLQGEYVKALKAYTKLVECDPSHEEACVGKVAALQKLNRPRGALKACQAALDRMPASQSLLTLREEISKELGDEATEVLAPAETQKELFVECAEDPSGFDDAGEYTDCDSTAASDVEDAEEASAPCPSAKSEAFARREAKALRLSRARPSGPREPDAVAMASEASAAWRSMRKATMIDCFRGFYAETRSKSVDTSSYTKPEKKGLTLKGAHQYMERPEHVDLPEDHGAIVGELSAEELAAFGCDHARGRLLISLHGDLFDVSDRPDKYGPEGPYSGMAGHDITWALWSGLDNEDEVDKYFDLHRAANVEERDRRFQGLMSWWAFFEQEYGCPVGRLSVYDREWELPEPPKVEDLCCIM